ncbi:MAG: Rpn family recombination-promoting nuclease/putative transposase, partial [Chthoniobacteraceae bacterium]|nr:Rpn family recombination-promoting nuclease/putative transposase [Chthoniobacteraceae bacterium]
LFTAKLHGEDAQFYILCEHQSSEDPLMALRVLSYMVRIWSAQAKSQTGRPRLMPIIPVVVAQDKKAWKTTARFHDLFALSPDKWEEVRAFTPDFAFRLLQLVDLPYESIQGTPAGVLTLRALKAEPLGKLLSAEVWEPALLRSVPIELLKYFIRYTFNADVDRTAFETKLKELLGPDLTQNSMTLADQYRQLGVEQGLFRGELKALHSLLFDVLEIRFQSVPLGLRNELSLIQDAQKLSELHRRAVQCATLEEFVAAL